MAEEVNVNGMSPAAYVRLKETRDLLKERMDTAETDPEYMAYKAAWRVLSQRYAKATELVVAAEQREANRALQKPSQRANGAGSGEPAETAAP